MSFKTKLILSYLIIVLVSFGFIAFFIDKNLEENSLREIKASLTNQANIIASQISAENLKREDLDYLDAMVRTVAPEAKCRISIIDSRGRVLADSEESREMAGRMENHMSRPEVRAALDGDIGIYTHYSNTVKISMLYIALPLKDKTGIIGVLRLALPLESIDKTLFAIRKVILLGLIFAIALSVIIGSIIASRIVGPVNSMINASRKYSEGDFSRRVAHISGDELGQLANTLNKMAQDIEEKISHIKTQNQRLTAIFSNMIEGVIVIDRSGRIMSVNHAVEKAFGIEKEKLEGALFLEVIRNNEIWETIASVLKTGKVISKEMSLVYPVRKIFRTNATPIFKGDTAAGCMVVMHDITEIRKLETMRSDFVANVSHELKTPLTSIKGFVETLLDGALDDKEHARSFIKIIHNHAERLEGLVGDLLSLAHLESKEIVLDIKELRLKKQADQIISAFAAQAERKGIIVKNELQSELLVRADKDKLDQVLTNLIDNAIKFNREKGFVKIYSSAMGSGVKITIEDSGSGIPEKDISRIFERFYRVDKARSRDLGGTGLGLSIVKHIVELHEGSVGVESIEGLGSKFWFILPAFYPSLKQT